MTSTKEHLGENESESETAPKKPLHRATYARDKKKGGYLIRVVGPYPAKFAGKSVPVTTKSGGVHEEKLDRLIWTGQDTDTPGLVALYTFESKPAEIDELPF